MHGERIPREIPAALDRLRLRRGSRIGVACSGGLDSVVLLRAAQDAARRTGSSLIVVHVQHRLRGAESAADEDFVRGLCRRRRIPLDVRTAPVDPGAAGIEVRARRARYEAFRAAAREHGLTHLLLAHHEDDQIETVLLRILRRAGARGLRGMPRSRRLLPGGCRLVRPFLGLPRAVLRDAAERLRLDHREDSSNLDRRFARNRVRHGILPALLETLPDARARLLRVAQAADSACRSLRRLRPVLERGVGLVTWPRGSAIDLQALRALPPVVVHDFLDRESRRLARRPLGARPFARIQDLLAGDDDGAVPIPGGSIARRRAGRLFFSSRAHPAPAAVALRLRGRTRWPALSGELAVSVLRGPGRIRSALDAAKSDPLTAVIDRRTVVGPISVHARQPGDSYLPLGAPGRKSLKRRFPEAGIPRELRGVWPVLSDDAGILWAPRLPPAHRARITAATREAIAIAWRGPSPSWRDQEPATM